MEYYPEHYNKQQVGDVPISECSCERSDLEGEVQELRKFFISIQVLRVHKERLVYLVDKQCLHRYWSPFLTKLNRNWTWQKERQEGITRHEA